MTTERDKTKECYDCKHMRYIPGDCHIRCANPDSGMKGHPNGIKNGWFRYPNNFDPTWKDKECGNYERL